MSTGSREEVSIAYCILVLLGPPTSSPHPTPSILDHQSPPPAFPNIPSPPHTHPSHDSYNPLKNLITTLTHTHPSPLPLQISFSTHPPYTDIPILHPYTTLSTTSTHTYTSPTLQRTTHFPPPLLDGALPSTSPRSSLLDGVLPCPSPRSCPPGTVLAPALGHHNLSVTLTLRGHQLTLNPQRLWSSGLRDREALRAGSPRWSFSTPPTLPLASCQRPSQLLEGSETVRRFR